MQERPCGARRRHRPAPHAVRQRALVLVIAALLLLTVGGFTRTRAPLSGTTRQHFAGVALAERNGWLALPADTPTTPTVATTATTTLPRTTTPSAGNDNSNFIAGLILMATGALLLLLLGIGAAAYVILRRRSARAGAIADPRRSTRARGDGARTNEYAEDDATEGGDDGYTRYEEDDGGYGPYADDGSPGGYNAPYRESADDPDASGSEWRRRSRSGRYGTQPPADRAGPNGSRYASGDGRSDTRTPRPRSSPSPGRGTEGAGYPSDDDDPRDYR
ncbi:MAG TPA: hypothetical protein VGN32_16120 [Ktedonobacterales bacterium]|nr:hypothetical protein [Ktedonobacterales bacterium]